MKKTVYIGLILMVLSFLTGCGADDNDYDGKNGLIQNPSTPVDALSSLQEKVFQAHANGLNEALNALKTTLNGLDTNLTTSDVTNLQNSFTSIMKEWKSVQATYVAGDYNSSLIDLPQFIDFFHTGKNLDVASDVEIALSQTTSIESSLFRNSSKSLTALEFLVFGRQTPTSELVVNINKNRSRWIDALKIVVDTLLKRTVSISNFYTSDIAFKANTTDASNALVNALIDSSYKLKEHRIGESAGYVVKYKDDPDASRLEFYNSKRSLEAIKAILVAHNEVMGEQSYENFGSFAIANGADTVVQKIRTNLINSLAIVEEFSTPIESVITTSSVDNKVKRLYDEVAKLQQTYFESLINALNLTAEIIEADGD
jgi:predicted lipoprotein